MAGERMPWPLRRLAGQGKAGCGWFLVGNTCLWGALGDLLYLALWAVLEIPLQWDWLLCAIGYPAVLLGLWGGIVLLYRCTDLEE